MNLIKDKPVLESINALPMSDNERRRALRALATAEAITDAMFTIARIFNRKQAEPQGALQDRRVNPRPTAGVRG